LLRLEWQRLSPDFCYTTPAAIADIGGGAEGDEGVRAGGGPYAGGAGEGRDNVVCAAAERYAVLAANGLREVAPYVLPMAYRVRFYMDMNAREAMHLIELRSTPQVHPAYRRAARRMDAL